MAKIKCPSCNKTRTVSRGMIYFIKSGKSSGKCRSCSAIGNKNRFVGKKYNTKKHYNSPTYKSWSNMKTRCYNKNVKDFVRYGGRGIRVCDRWMEFKNFLDDMGEKPANKLSIDRIDNNGNYELNNCRWATKTEQANNTRNIERAERITFDGITKTIYEWAKELGIKRTTLGMRLQKYNWTIERALFT